MRRLPLAVTASATATALLVLAGCSTGGETEAEVEPDPSASEETAAPPAPRDPLDPACLIGDWRIAQDQLQGFYDAVSASADGLTFTVTGDTGLSFTTDSYLYTPAFTLGLDVAGVAGEGVTTGSLGGSYTAADGVITTTVRENSLSTVVTINGITQDASAVLGGVIASDPISEAPYDCTDPDAPVLQFETGAGARTPVELSPAG